MEPAEPTHIRLMDILLLSMISPDSGISQGSEVALTLALCDEESAMQHGTSRCRQPGTEKPPSPSVLPRYTCQLTTTPPEACAAGTLLPKWSYSLSPANQGNVYSLSHSHPSFHGIQGGEKRPRLDLQTLEVADPGCQSDATCSHSRGAKRGLLSPRPCPKEHLISSPASFPASPWAL